MFTGLEKQTNVKVKIQLTSEALVKTPIPRFTTKVI